MKGHVPEQVGREGTLMGERREGGGRVEVVQGWRVGTPGSTEQIASIF